MEHLLSHLFLFIFLSSLRCSLCQLSDVSPGYLACGQTFFTCGASNLTVSYPFLADTKPGRCGFPGYRLTCVAETGTPIVTISKKQYSVKNIDYGNHLLTVVDTTYVGQTCPQYTNTTIEPAMFQYSDRDTNVTVYFNCSSSPADIPPSNDIGCLLSGAGGLAYYRLDNASNQELQSKCSIAFVPMDSIVANMLVNGKMNSTQALLSGFSLRWIAGDGWCDDCSSTGGFCGYNSSSPADQTCFCGDQSVLGSCPSKGDSSGTRKIIIGIGAGIGGFILASAAGFIWYRHKRRKHLLFSSAALSKTASSRLSYKKDPQLGSAHYYTHIFSYEELEEATDCFDSTKELGDGGYGTVYKGKLRDGRVVAVKRLYENSFKGVGQFMNEVEILSRLRHENLVTLYGCTSHHSRDLLLVYEFVANGTVADHLHGHRASEGFLTWPVRMNIALETADALAYLHAAEPPIVHRDVKTTNILLDKSYHVKVADFGLSRLFPTAATHVSTAPQGTPGYVDPEYYLCYQLTDKSDVYSFGVVLVELISSKPAVDVTRQRTEINLASLATDKIQKGEVDQLVDPHLGYQSDWHVQNMIAQVAELAFRCLQSDRDMRPPMKEVLEVLRAVETRDKYSEDKAEALIRDDAVLLKRDGAFSPDTVTGRWMSRSTTPNTSG